MVRVLFDKYTNFIQFVENASCVQLKDRKSLLRKMECWISYSRKITSGVQGLVAGCSQNTSGAFPSVVDSFLVGFILSNGNISAFRANMTFITTAATQ